MNCNYKVKITDIQTKYKFKVFCTGYDDSEIKEKIDAMYQAWPKASAEGETPTLDNTANATMTIDLKGNTSQETTTGKNLLAYPYYDTTKTINGITFTDNGDGTINANGTASANASFFLLGNANNQEEIKGNYISGGASYNVKVRAVNLTSGTYTVLGSSEGSPTSLNKSTYSRGYIEIVIVNGTTVNNLTIKPMLTNNEDSDYEPYTNGASPNPDYPQDVEVVTGDNTIKVEGKNLVNFGTQNFTTYKDYTGLFFPAGTYTFSAKVTSSDTSQIVSRVYFYGESGGTNQAFINLSRNTRANATITTTFDIKRIVLYSSVDYASSNGKTATYENIQLERSSTATDYEPYQSQSYAVNLGSMELCKIGDYQDYIYKEGKKWYKYGAIGKVVFNGSESWSDFSVGDTNFRCQYDVTLPNILTPPTNPAQLFSNYFKAINRDNAYAKTEIGIAQYGSTLGKVFICAPNTILSEQTLASWKTWLSTHNTIVYYVLATPTNTLIEDTTLISQLNALAGAESYSGQTNISQTNNDKPFIITAKALKDLSNL